MAKRRESADNYIDPKTIMPRTDPVNSVTLGLAIPLIVDYFDTSIIKQHQEKPDWSKYRIEMRQGNPFIVREFCDRCGNVWIPPSWRKIRSYLHETLGIVYLETGICKECINASLYSDIYLDGEPLGHTDSRKLFIKYAEDYERAWRVVIAAAPKVIMSDAEWMHRCDFFNGCVICGGKIEVRTMYFPRSLNGTFSPWNVIPMCGTCQRIHYIGRMDRAKQVKLYRVFCTEQKFNKLKTTRMFLIQQMREHKIYFDPLLPFMKRFKETKILEGSVFNAMYR